MIAPRGPFPTTVFFDQTAMRPGCILLQAAMRCRISSHDLSLLSSVRGAEWLTSVTPDMRPYTIHTAEEFERVREAIRLSHRPKTTFNFPVAGEVGEVVVGDLPSLAVSTEEQAHYERSVTDRRYPYACCTTCHQVAKTEVAIAHAAGCHDPKNKTAEEKNEGGRTT